MMKMVKLFDCLMVSRERGNFAWELGDSFRGTTIKQLSNQVKTLKPIRPLLLHATATCNLSSRALGSAAFSSSFFFGQILLTTK